MISIRHFTEHDAIIIQQKQYTETSITDIYEMITEWESNTYQGKYFEMFAIIADDAIVGSVSLYEQCELTIRQVLPYITVWNLRQMDMSSKMQKTKMFLFTCSVYE